MCGQNTSVDQFAKEFSDTNGDLPTTTLDNGNKATVIAGTPNPHLSIRKAMGSVTARSYFVKAFVELSAEDQDAFIAEHDLKDLAILTAYVVDDFNGMGGFAYKRAGTLDDASEFVGNIADRVIAVIGETEEASAAYAEELDGYYTEKWESLVDEDKAADRAARSSNSTEDVMVEALMQMLGKIGA
jgi:hypothetical protein